MIDGRVKTITSYIRRYDPDLYADRSRDGKIEIYRKAKIFERYELDGKNLYVSTIQPQHVTTLTEDWSFNAPSRDWGIDPVLDRLKRMDQWRKEDALERVRRHNEKIEENSKRAFRNDLRARAADCRREFAQATNDIRTANMNTKSNRGKKENGYRK